MKFTKQNAVESITAKFADKAKGIDLARTIEEAVSNGIEMIGEDSEMELDAFVAIVEKNVSSALGLARHLKTTASTELQQQIDELKRKLEGNEPQKTERQTSEIKSEDPAIKALMDKMTEMEERLQRRETENAVSEKRRQLVSKMSESIKDKGWIEDYLKEISITAETDVETKAKDFVEFYNKTQSSGGRTTPKPTNGNDDAADSYVKSTVAEAAKIKKNLSTTTGGSPIRSTTTN